MVNAPPKSPAGLSNWQKISAGQAPIPRPAHKIKQNMTSEVNKFMWFNNNNNCSCLWIILIIILLFCCCGWGNNNCGNVAGAGDNDCCC